MKYTFLFLALSFGLSIQCHSQNVMDDREPSEYFDFWVGKWKVSWEEGNGMGKGTNHIERILDGTVIRENFRILEGQNTGFQGTSISVYQPRLNLWKQVWADNQGGYFDFTGKVDGEKRIFQTEISEREDGSRITQRMVFYDITNGSLTWDWESSTDGGETWTLNWRIFYERMDE
ncbi:hypothetical protein [Rhodohalobacter sp. 614A]|uniref:hypothetical protein n=1 Tax=Rhodohalobacter sp. 614A TaxID=2908649 RepID=UPI001F1F79DF|nr:hypothetical protein [Rhodohalobacter sp. 614A]